MNPADAAVLMALLFLVAAIRWAAACHRSKRRRR
jgi:hypothetical protein